MSTRRNDVELLRAAEAKRERRRLRDDSKRLSDAEGREWESRKWWLAAQERER